MTVRDDVDAVKRVHDFLDDVAALGEVGGEGGPVYWLAEAVEDAMSADPGGYRARQCHRALMEVVSVVCSVMDPADADELRSAVAQRVGRLGTEDDDAE